VTNSGDIDGTTVYYWDKNQIVETRDGSGNVQMQVYHGTQYIDEVVGLKLADFGRVYLHQAEGDQGGSLKDYNVIAMTDLTGRTLERYYYSPYGEPEAVVNTHVFDYEGDGDLDDLDIAAATSSGVCWGDYSGDCRRLDADADGDIDADDYDAIVAYADMLTSENEIQRVPAASRSMWGNVFGHQGLVLDTEIGSYQNRARQYAPKAKRFMQRDPLVFERSAESGYQDGLNIYARSMHAPLKLFDPSGHFSCKCADKTISDPRYTAETLCCMEGGQCQKKTLYQPFLFLKMTARGIYCLEKHEEKHKDHFTCGPNCETQREPEYQDTNKSECEAYKVQTKCLHFVDPPATRPSEREKLFVSCMVCSTCDDTNPGHSSDYGTQLERCEILADQGGTGCP
jgi:RHS repeat-associated protein